MSDDPLAVPEVVAFAGDWHANTRWGAAAIGHAAEQGADVIVQLGDFGYDYQSGYLRSLDEALARTGLQLLFVDGNHENFEILLRYPVRPNGLGQVTERIWHLPRGFRWSWGGRRWLALGGAHSVDRPWRTPGVSWWSEETVSWPQAQRAAQGGPVDILVAHDCPAGVPIPGLDPGAWPAEQIAAAEAHRDTMRQVVDLVQPRAIWHGHYHVPYAATVDLGYGPVEVRGLDCDGTTMAGNIAVVPLAEVV